MAGRVGIGGRFEDGTDNLVEPLVVEAWWGLSGRSRFWFCRDFTL